MQTNAFMHFMKVKYKKNLVSNDTSQNNVKSIENGVLQKTRLPKELLKGPKKESQCVTHSLQVNITQPKSSVKTSKLPHFHLLVQRGVH